MGLTEWLQTAVTHPYFRPFVGASATALVVVLVHFVVGRAFAAIAARTQPKLDDHIVAAVRPAALITVLALGVWFIIEPYAIPVLLRDIIAAVLCSGVVLAWALASNAVADAVLDALAARMQTDSVLQPRTLPLFRIGSHILVWGGAVYGAMLAWGIDVRAWLASAGIVGIAFGFAAKDTLANLFAGVFIIADRPYRVGDFLNLDTGERGRVTEIGFRSTRLVTLDDIEVIVPNALMANVRVINESGGPRLHMRVRNTITLSYGADIDKVQALILGIIAQNPLVTHDDPSITPRVRVMALGPNGVVLDVQMWVLDPELRDPATHEVLAAVYRLLTLEGIPFAHTKQDLYVKELPAAHFGG